MGRRRGRAKGRSDVATRERARPPRLGVDGERGTVAAMLSVARRSQRGGGKRGGGGRGFKDAARVWLEGRGVD